VRFSAASRLFVAEQRGIVCRIALRHTLQIFLNNCILIEFGDGVGLKCPAPGYVSPEKGGG
jgi:hypothetical protein